MASAAILIFIQSDFFPAKHDSFFQKAFCCESLSGKKRGGVCQAWAYLGPSEFPSRKRSFVRGRIKETVLTEWQVAFVFKSHFLLPTGIAQDRQVHNLLDSLGAGFNTDHSHLSFIYILTLASSTRSSQVIPHPCTLLSQCCLTSVYEWELVHPTWHGHKQSNGKHESTM